jgi:hypothetical protein
MTAEPETLLTAEEPVEEDVPEIPDWFTDDGSEELDASFKDYDITASPNDFNVRTIVDFIDAGPVKIPGFQRNYVWDIKRASKLIESILIGLPIPQIFLYEEERNSYLVIDGQQRLMSVYYFVKGRFPRRNQRSAVRRIMAEKGILPREVFSDDKYFEKFNLSLPPTAPNQQSRFHRLNYDTLGKDQTTFTLRTIRNVIIKQNAPEEDRDTCVFEIFNRLNTGGVNLRPQEIRSSLYHSEFMDALNRINLNGTWRRLLGQDEPDLHAKDVEILLRAFAMVATGEAYTEPMSRFLNLFSRNSRRIDPEKMKYTEDLFSAFFDMLHDIPVDSFRVRGGARFSIAMFEAVFRAVCTDGFKAGTTEVWPVTAERLAALKADAEFVEATQYGIGRAVYVKQRYDRARVILKA